MIKVLELFSGYGGANFALKKAGIEHECIGYSDIEKCANYIYPLNHTNVDSVDRHGEVDGFSIVPQLGDVTKIDEKALPDFDLLTGGFPCQSFSMAGKREGFKAERKGQLFFDIIRIAEAKKPRWMLLENVEGLLSHDDGQTFKVVLDELKAIGYHIRWKKLYSKNHGTPQNRPRVWIACFINEKDYEKFMFPEKEKLTLTVKDLLEDEVDEKYYLSEKQLEKINLHIKYSKEKGRGFGNFPLDVNSHSTTLTSHMKIDINDVPYFKIADFRYDEGIRVRKDNMCPTLTSGNTGSGLSGQPIVYNTAHTKSNGVAYTLDTSAGQAVEIIDDRASEKFRGDSRKDGICPTLKSTRSNYYAMKKPQKKWRRLTPKECFRLMGFFNDEIKFGDLSDSKLYFLAGNGWDINTASKIFKQMFIGNSNSQRGLFDYD